LYVANFDWFETCNCRATPLRFLGNWSGMSENKELQQRIQRIGGLVQEIESIADLSVRASTKELVQLLMEFHGAGLDRAMEIVAETGEAGLRLIDEFGRDSLVSSLLVLYGLHPDDLATRVNRAVEQVRPKVQRNGGEVELLGIEEGAVRLRLALSGHACGSTGATLQSMVEEAIYEAAPDVVSIAVRGLEGKAADGFVPLDKLLGSRSLVSGASESLAMGVSSPPEQNLEQPVVG
jgi:Fe-S cluster biogenesis protein NfuA